MQRPKKQHPVHSVVPAQGHHEVPASRGRGKKSTLKVAKLGVILMARSYAQPLDVQ